MKELNTEEVYATPSTKVVSDDEKVVGQLCLFLSQLKVVNLLRQDGMSYDDAKALVETNVAEANRILRKKNLIWNILGYLFLLPIAWMLVMMGVYGFISVKAVLLVAILGAISWKFFSLRDKIKF